AWTCTRAVRSGWAVSGAPPVGGPAAPAGRVRGFFGVDAPGATCKIGWIRIPGGAVIEIFHFEPQQPPQPAAWSRVGMTHVCLNVRGIQRWHEYLVSKGVEIVSPPLQAPRGHWLFFAKDFDGNLIEITDLGYMYYVLAWLGPLGGWIFRRGREREYSPLRRVFIFAAAGFCVRHPADASRLAP